jgi:hypothetical protein
MTHEWLQPPLTDLAQPYVASFTEKQRLDNFFSESGATLVEFDLTEIRTITDWFVQMRRSLPYPDWAGGGWDSLDDAFQEVAESWPFPLVFSFVGIASPTGDDLRVLLEVTLRIGELQRNMSMVGRQLIPVYYESAD